MKIKEKKTPAKNQAQPATSQPSIFRKIYNSLPLLPLLDRSTSAIAYACIFGYILFMLYVFLAMPPVQLSSSIVEAPLAKNSPLMLFAGETYAYELSGEMVAAPNKKVVYGISSSSSCPGILVTEQASEFASSECLSKQTGNAVNDERQLNSSTGNQSFLLFSPWMLAVSDNFSWQAASTTSAAGVEMRFTTSLKSFGKKEIAGRQAYEISVASPALSSASKYFIDAEKRVLLYAESGNLTVRLIKAPFELHWSNKN
ncbi:MAG: hypothetical protein QW568_02925 [Candidatus Anstonellaceae archaeon]